MNFKKSSSYVQRQTNQMLRFYRQFFRVFMNDIVIFSHILKKHLRHLHQIFEFFQNKRVNLTSIKSFLNYFFIILLKQRVNSLDLFIFEKKIVVIVFLRFSKLLKNLNYFLSFIDWLRHCVERYSQLTQSLIICKTTLIKLIIINNNTRKKQSTQLKIFDLTSKKTKFFNQLQKTFVDFIFFIYFDFNRRLYIDLNVFKRWSFVVIVYHVLKNSIENVKFARIDVQFFFFQQVSQRREKKLLIHWVENNRNNMNDQKNSTYDKIDEIVVDNYLHESFNCDIYFQTNHIDYNKYRQVQSSISSCFTIFIQFQHCRSLQVW